MAIINDTTDAGAKDVAISDEVFGFVFQAIDAPMWVNISADGTDAAAGTGIYLAQGASFNFIKKRNETVSVYSATGASQKFAVMEVD